MSDEAQHVLHYWLDEVGPDGWYGGGPELDADIAANFAGLWARARAGGLSLWLTHPSGVLAYLILTDQFPRNMFRGTAQAFATDGIARGAAVMAVDRKWDCRIDPPGRQFFYLPFEHSENRHDQDRAVRLFADRMPEAKENMLHAKAHREVIRRFGRFPFRNEALGRASTPEEAKWLEEGGYGAVVRRMQGDDPAD